MGVQKTVLLSTENLCTLKLIVNKSFTRRKMYENSPKVDALCCNLCSEQHLIKTLFSIHSCPTILCVYFCSTYNIYILVQKKHRYWYNKSGSSVVECLTRDRHARVRASPASLRCVLEQGTLIPAKYRFNPGRHVPL